MTIDTWLAIAAGLLALAAWWHGRAGRSSQEGAARPSDAPGTSHVPGIAGTRPGYRRILSAAELLQLTGGDRLIDRLLRESRLPPALFERDLLVALQRCAALVQLLPAGLEDPQGDPGGLLRRTLERTLHALALRAGHVLPRQAGAERVDAHRDAWTCAVFLGALLHGLGEPLTSLRIDLCGAGEGESIP